MNRTRCKIILNSVSMLAMAFCFLQCHRGNLFSELSPEDTHIDFVNQLSETEDVNIYQYLYAHNGGGVAIGDINNDGLPDLYLTANQLSKRLYLNKGNFVFEDITEKAGVLGCSGETCWTTGVTMVDINNDGLLDIYVSQVSNYNYFQGQNQLYVNNGDLTFTDKASAYGLDFQTYSQQAAFFDYDLDGDLDMYHLNVSVKNPSVYGKAADLKFQRDSLAGDQLLRNDNGVFVDVSEEAGILGSAINYGLAVAVADIDGNGCPDLFVSNDFHENDYVYYNNCDGTFREAINGTLAHTSTFSMGSDIADVNNDGLLDILTVDMKPEEEVLRKSNAGSDPLDIFNFKLSYGYFYQYPRNMLQINQGNLFGSNVQFSEVGQLSGLDATDWSWSALMTDLDNDGWKDIFITNGILRRPIDLDYINFTYNENASVNMSSLEKSRLMPPGLSKNYAYKNIDGIHFENTSTEWALDLFGCSNGASYSDLDNDGDLDLVVNNLNAPASIYRNNTEDITGNNYVKFLLIGPDRNRFAVGAQIVVELAERNLTQVINPTRGWLSSVDYALTFGIGKETSIKSVTVRWPDGKTQKLAGVEINSTTSVRYQEAIKGQSKEIQRTNTPFINFTAESGIDFIHHENAYNDFAFEPLMPHSLSTEGPALCVGDVNGDSLDDFFVGGSFGQAGTIYVQKNSERVAFEKLRNPDLETDLFQENTDAVFFDVDRDGDLDLYVVNGGNENRYPVRSTDRLYVNDGAGHFAESKELIPQIEKNGSCVVADDFNQDGFTDLFLGSISVAGQYGQSPASYVLWGNKSGRYSIDDKSSLKISSLGMVSDAAWLPITRELVVVGKWMPITFVDLKHDNVMKREIPGSSGLWNVVYPSDIDDDGDLDILAGNMGLNTNLKASPSEPIQLYVCDFDNNQTSECLLTYYRQGHESLFPSMDELKKQIPSIRKKFDDYKSFANSSLQNIISAENIKQAKVLRAELLASVVLYNDGKSNFTITELPAEAQLSATYSFVVLDFDGDGKKDIVGAGNFYGCPPSIGRFDASYGYCLARGAEDDFKNVSANQSGFSIFGEVRGLKRLRSPGAEVILASRNNAAMRAFLLPARSNVTRSKNKSNESTTTR